MDDNRQPWSRDRDPASRPDDHDVDAEHVCREPLRLILQETGVAVTLDRSGMVMGRHSRADIHIPLPDVSRSHCRFLLQDGRWTVLDLDSLNGIFVNDRRVREVELRHLDRLRVGGFTFVVNLAAAPSLPAQDATDTTRGDGIPTPQSLRFPTSPVDEGRRRAS